MAKYGHMTTTRTAAQTERDIKDVLRKWGIERYDVRRGLTDAEVCTGCVDARLELALVAELGKN